MASWRVRKGWHFNWNGQRLAEQTPVVGITDEEANRYANLETYQEETPNDVKQNRRAKPKASTPGDSDGDD